MWTAVIHEEDGIFVADCPEAGTASQGHSVEEALQNLKEATQLYLEEFPQSVRSHPFVTTFEMAHA
ncbi:MAG: type II toxin-antitoxin system HicB family antitoxin [Candidatus Peribacteraceae bacterium]|nr:type II toxin-antitoxin system HicB family antitoxin [Candidatus Peribacteraceae bacterium]